VRARSVASTVERSSYSATASTWPIHSYRSLLWERLLSDLVFIHYTLLNAARLATTLRTLQAADKLLTSC
jgi:hypothetical protein